MKIWNYDPATGELLGVGSADPDPRVAGEWILPAHATAIAPGDTQPGRAWRFNSCRVWENVADCRRETWWKADAKDNTEPVVVDFIGNPSHQGLTNTEPPAPPEAPPEPVIASAHQLFAALAAALGKTPAEIEELAKIAKSL